MPRWHFSTGCYGTSHENAASRQDLLFRQRPDRLSLIFPGRRGQLEARHLLAVTHKQFAVRHDRMIPSLALNGFEAGNFSVLLRLGGNQRHFARFGQHQQQRLVGQQQHLPAAVATGPPGGAARRPN